VVRHPDGGTVSSSTIVNCMSTRMSFGKVGKVVDFIVNHHPAVINFIVFDNFAPTILLETFQFNGFTLYQSSSF
jgi:hypothetical protein